MMVTEMCKLLHLESLLAYSKELGAEVRYHPEHGYFTAMVWGGWDNAFDVKSAQAVQRQIQRQSAQYPGIVCYCFDAFSTLVYAV
jgi:hypothetical protein